MALQSDMWHFYFFSSPKRMPNIFLSPPALFSQESERLKNIIMFSLVTQHIKSVSIHFGRKQPSQHTNTISIWCSAKKSFKTCILKSREGECVSRGDKKQQHSTRPGEGESRDVVVRTQTFVWHITLERREMFIIVILEQICYLGLGPCKTPRRKDLISQQEIPLCLWWWREKLAKLLFKVFPLDLVGLLDWSENPNFAIFQTVRG
jgi:hypothetical protein